MDASLAIEQLLRFVLSSSFQSTGVLKSYPILSSQIYLHRRQTHYRTAVHFRVVAGFGHDARMAPCDCGTASIGNTYVNLEPGLSPT